MLAGCFRVLDIDRARVRLLFSDADRRQKVDQDFGLDLQLARQLVQPYLFGIGHPPLFETAVLLAAFGFFRAFVRDFGSRAIRVSGFFGFGRRFFS
jgi:hypothetical protein